jgi:hypothetical protein
MDWSKRMLLCWSVISSLSAAMWVTIVALRVELLGCFHFLFPCYARGQGFLCRA